MLLYSFDGVIYTFVLYDQYGAAYVKPSAFLHNSPTLHGLRIYGPYLATVTLRGLVRWQGEWVARTHLASIYPPRLGSKYGQLVADSLEHRSVAIAAGEPIPQACQADDFGFPLPSPDEGWLNVLVGDDARCSPDVGMPFVAHGGGAPKGLSHREHV